MNRLFELFAHIFSLWKQIKDTCADKNISSNRGNNGSLFECINFKFKILLKPRPEV